MKSLALHLLAILLLGSLQITANKYFLTTAATTVSASTQAIPTATTKPTTTQQLPTLHAPRRSSQPTTTLMTTPNTEATTTTTTTAAIATAKSRQRQQTLAVRLSTAQANAMANNKIEATSSTFTSARLVRNANIANTSDGLRPNRSLQSTTTAVQHNSNSNNNNSSSNSVEAATKNQQTERRRPRFGPNKDNTNSNGNKTAEVIANMNTSRTSIRPRTSYSSADDSSSAEHEHATFKLPTNSRQPKSIILAVDSNDELGRHAPHSINSTKSQQTLKTPRMIQRLVAGHIQNAQGRSKYEVSAVTTNSSISSSTDASSNATLPLYYRRKEMVLSSSFRQSKISTTTAAPTTVITTSKPLPTINNLNATVTKADDYEDRNDDEALLDDPGDFDNWDNGILRLSAGSGKESSIKSKKNKEDSKKTLSDQVRDGKYGLIEKELFRREPKRPGVLSYLPNKEVPFDNERNFGGLNEEDIWLAEDHLLVIKGGSLNEDKLDEPWPPIDDYDAPTRQIKIPKHPKVPPPFPVQLEENGPIQFIGNSKFTVVYPVTNESLPVYPVGPETNYASPENDSDDEKNLITGTRPPQNTAKTEPGYLYPAPYPPWLYHNQTFVNPILSNARPINFPSLGPFPFGRNGSLENSNGTDYFDEDDPALYYPPAYSFVYKNNYTNPVPPGPLVPGIVLPPPPDQFSRLEKTDKPIVTSTSAPITSSAPPRYRTYTTTTTTTTTEQPYRQVITKISEYTPKTITITPIPATVPLATSAKSIVRFPATTPATNTDTVTAVVTAVQPVPVPVAIPVPFYPNNNYPTERPSVVSFVPTTPTPTTDTLSKTNPIYYEYVEAKRKPTTSNVIDDFLSTTNKPTPAPRPVKLYATSKRPFKGQSQRNYLQAIPPNRPYVPENIVYITPKPEIRYKPPAQVSIYKPRPLENFENEVNAIRETLRYYQNQQLRDNSIPRTPKAKTVYEYTFDATKNLQPTQHAANGNFKPPAEFDEEPFQPMVTYSPPVDDENAFKAIAYDKVDNEQPEVTQSKYQTSTTLVPVEPEQQYQRTTQGRAKKLRLSAKYLHSPLVNTYQPQQQQEPRLADEYQSTPRTILTTQAPWVSISEQRLNDFRQATQQQDQYERIQAPYKNRFPGYYYGPPQPPIRQNNRFYDEPFQGPVRKIINYRPQQQQQQQQPVWSLENDTYVNYAPNRPPLNPDAEFIDPYQTIPINAYANTNTRLPLPALSHQSQYYAQPQRLQPPPLRQQQQPQQQLQQQLPLHRDILVNYRQPLPPLNPESEYITQPQVLRNQPHAVYRQNTYRHLPNGGEQGNVYYITPKYRRAFNSNNNRNNNNSNNNNNNNNNNANTGNENNGK